MSVRGYAATYHVTLDSGGVALKRRLELATLIVSMQAIGDNFALHT
jgi:hypothetical protein